WNLRGLEFRLLWTLFHSDQRVCRGHSGPVTCVAFTPDGTRIITGSYDHTLRVWGAENGEELLTLKGHTALVLCAAMSPDGKRIVSGGGDLLDTRKPGPARPGELIVWDADTGQEVHALKGHTECVTCVSYSPDGTHIVSGSHDRTLRVWDAEK